jgi:hypothetical protein
LAGVPDHGLSVDRTVAALRAAGAEVLTMRLPDPGQMCGLPGPDPEPTSPPPTRGAEMGWMATKGTAWLVRRSRDLVPALVGLAVREWLGLGREGPGPQPEPQPGPENTEPKYPEPEITGLVRVNLNVLSKPSGNLELHECLPSAQLKVRDRFSNVTKRRSRTAAVS